MSDLIVTREHGSIQIRDPSVTHGDPEVFIMVDAERVKEIGAIGTCIVHVIIKGENGKEGRVALRVSHYAPTDRIEASMTVQHRTNDSTVKRAVPFVVWGKV